MAELGFVRRLHPSPVNESHKQKRPPIRPYLLWGFLIWCPFLSIPFAILGYKLQIWAATARVNAGEAVLRSAFGDDALFAGFFGFLFGLFLTGGLMLFIGRPSSNDGIPTRLINSTFGGCLFAMGCLAAIFLAVRCLLAVLGVSPH